MSATLPRRGILSGGLAAVFVAAGGRLVAAAAKPTVTVHKSPT
jgi:hypothetical protein